MTERNQVVNQLVFAASALRSLDLGVIGDLLGRAYDAGAAAERAAIAKWLREEGHDQMAGYDIRLAASIEAGHHKEPK